MNKLLSLSLILSVFSFKVAISQTVTEKNINAPNDSIVKAKAADSVVKPVVKTYEIKPGTVQPGSDTLALKRNQQKKNNDINESKENNPNTKQTVTNHAPDANDPDYTAKFEQWKKDYPDEFSKMMAPVTDKNIIKQAQEQSALDSKGNQVPNAITNEANKTVKVKENLTDLPPSSGTYETKQPVPESTETVKTDNVIKVDTVVVQKKDTAANKFAEHAPTFDDPDYSAKKDKWVKEYPDEYNKTLSPKSDNSDVNIPVVYSHSDSLLIQVKQQMAKQKQTDSIAANLKKIEDPQLKKKNDSIQKLKYDSIRNSVYIPQKVSEHAPLFNDPNYAAKKQEWMSQYPDEYNKQLIITDEQKQTYLEKLKDTNPSQYDEQLQNYRKSNPDFYKKHMEWLKINDPEHYKLLK